MAYQPGVAALRISYCVTCSTLRVNGLMEVSKVDCYFIHLRKKGACDAGWCQVGQDVQPQLRSQPFS